jgi:hypothetical protein
MATFGLGSILQTVSQLAPIAAEVRPKLLSTSKLNDGEPPSIGLVDFIPHPESQAIYAANNANEAIGLSFQKATNTEAGGGVESVVYEVPPRSGVNVTQDFDIFGDTGAVSAAPADVPAELASGPGAPVRKLIQYLPLLTATTFAAFGGTLSVRRETRNTPSGTIGIWSIGANSRLTDILFNYAGPTGKKIDFKAKLSPPPNVGSGDFPFTYEVPMPDPTAVTGPITDFNMTILGEAGEIAKITGPDRSIPFDKLPPGVRARLRAAS